MMRISTKKVSDAFMDTERRHYMSKQAGQPACYTTYK